MKKSTFLATAGLLLTLQMGAVSANTVQDARSAIESQNYAVALDQLRPLAREGNADASNLLGQMYEQGLGVNADEEEAARLYRQGANQGHLDSITSLRALQNKAFAQEFSRLMPIAKAGNAEAQNRIGEMLEFGQGVERDKDAAYQWFQRAAEQGELSAWHNLGRSYNFGSGVEQDYAIAEEWYRKAAERGYTQSLFFLGTLYATAHGQDDSYNTDIIAYAWLKNAADLGDQTARPIADRLLLKLNEEEIETAKSLAERYKERYISQ
ncbi:tetratricopeptide repeat protein [Nitrincola schmidtii]|uniref:tetratricopeptide repeat protein n=1 Tax=Nitrincola schmidtii TaxID=1730894 RepID=UPI00124F581E|nr:tetratricopeptide repeat protein [Nitrincola schmidtii]